jgi:GTP diphosphokinase / guanosine-3',5'-bis(diphosphate) 3'-diphosphatase
LPDQPVEVHTIECDRLASGVDADWVDLSWGQGSDGASARVRVVIHNRPGTLGEIAGIFGYHKANIINLRMTVRDSEFHTFEVDLEVHDLPHLMRIISALRSSEAVATADRVYD